MEKKSSELFERHLHHIIKIKHHTLHISSLDKINMCLEMVNSDRCITFVAVYCLKVKEK